MGEFERKCKEADCHLVNTEPFPPWSQLEEGCIRELKRLSSQQLINMFDPKRLWDHSIELAALICSQTAHSNYELEGKVSDTRMTGKTADISNICDYEWYEWEMFCDGPTSYPESPMTLGRYISP